MQTEAEETRPSSPSPALSVARVAAPDVEALAALDEAADEAAVPVVELVAPRGKGGAAKRTPKRKLTVLVGRMSTAALDRGARKADALLAELDPRDVERPRTRGECRAQGLGMPGHPCPFVSCPRSLLVDPSRTAESLSLNRLGARKYDAPEASVAGNVEEIFDPGFEYTCASAAAEGEQGMSHEQIAVVLGVTKQGVQQLEARALDKLRAAGIESLAQLMDYWR